LLIKKITKRGEGAVSQRERLKQNGIWVYPQTHIGIERERESDRGRQRETQGEEA